MPQRTAMIVVVALLVGLMVLVVTCQQVGLNVHTTDVGPTPTPAPPTPTPTVVPPPPGIAYRGVAAIQAVNDTSTGDSSGTANANPFDGNQDYGWVDDTLFHVADRVPGTTNSLTLDGCIDAGMPAERYLFTEPSTYGPPTSVTFNGGGPNQAAVWPAVTTIYGHGVPTPIPTPLPPVPTPSGYVPPTPVPTPTPDYTVYASVWQQNCQVLGGATITIEP